MNLILLDPHELGGGGSVRLEGRRFEYVRDVHRSGPGDELRVGVLGGGVGRGRIIAIGNDTLEMKVVIDREPPAPLPVTLVLALPRPLVLRRVLIHATSLGVKRIALIQTNRVEKSFWQSDAVSGESLRTQLVVGLEQAEDTVLPDVTLHRRFRPFVEDELPALLSGAQGIVAHVGALAGCPRDVQRPVVLAVGPEGGFIPYEIERFEEAGMTVVNLGDRAIRVEAVVPFAIARLT